MSDISRKANASPVLAGIPLETDVARWVSPTWSPVACTPVCPVVLTVTATGITDDYGDDPAVPSRCG